VTKPLKYRFEFYYQDSSLRDLSSLMSKLDLGMDGLALREVITFEYTKEEKPIQYFKDLINTAYERMGCKIIDIKGGKIE